MSSRGKGGKGLGQGRREEAPEDAEGQHPGHHQECDCFAENYEKLIHKTSYTRMDADPLKEKHADLATVT
jgi:hypothetical protein